MIKGFKRKRMFSLLLAVVIMCSMVFTGNAATATIKTQAAADRIEGGVRGIDVSKYQGEINWSKVAQDNVDFAFIRATCGWINKGKYELNIDPMFSKNAKGADKYGIKVGAYHYACLTSEKRMKSEAKTFLKTIGKVNITYPVVLDIESNPGGLSKAELSKLAKGFADIIKAEGYTVMIYSYQNFFKNNLDVSKLGKHKLWVANYSETPKDISHSIWQHTSQGKVKGISGNVDVNIAYPNFESKKWKSIVVNKEISDTIKERLKKYKLKPPESGLVGIHEVVYSAMQLEINKALDTNYAINGQLTTPQLEYLAYANYPSGSKRNLTYLLQARLFYLGYYKVSPTSKYDQTTKDAVKAFQKDNGITADGKINEDTIFRLM